MAIYLDGIQTVENNREVKEYKLFDTVPFTDTAMKYSQAVAIDGMLNKRIMISNGCNQTVTVTHFWSPDNVTFYSMSTQSVAASGNSVIDTANSTVQAMGINGIKGFYKMGANFGTAPTSGNIKVWLHMTK